MIIEGVRGKNCWRRWIFLNKKLQFLALCCGGQFSFNYKKSCIWCDSDNMLVPGQPWQARVARDLSHFGRKMPLNGR